MDTCDSPRRRFAVIATLLLVLIVALVVNVAAMLYLHDEHCAAAAAAQKKPEALYEREDISTLLVQAGCCTEGCNCEWGDPHTCAGKPIKR